MRGTIITSRSLNWLRPIVTKWTHVVELFSNAHKGDDACYWYNERCNIGILAAAAWLSGAMSLEEFSNFKSNSDHARTDLFLCDANETHSAAVEAKYVYRKADDTTDKFLKHWLHNACEAARKNNVSWGEKIGCVFIVPRFPKENGPVNPHAIRRLVNAVKDSKLARMDLVAWSFPVASSELHFGDWIYPGVILVMRVAYRRSVDA